MRVMVPVHESRISPVLDVARQFLLVEVAEGQGLERSALRLREAEATSRARALRELGPGILICGAVSRWFASLLANAGIQVFPNTCGPVDEVIAAFVSGRLTEDAYLMPGCPRRGEGRRRLRCKRGAR